MKHVSVKCSVGDIKGNRGTVIQAFLDFWSQSTYAGVDHHSFPTKLNAPLAQNPPYFKSPIMDFEVAVRYAEFLIRV